MAPRPLLAAPLLALALAGCLAPAATLEPTGAALPMPLAYEVRAPDADLALLEHVELVPLVDEAIAIHARVVRPDVQEPVPVVVMFTPYTAPGRATAIEPAIRAPAGTMVQELARRGFAFVQADVRGTGDSGGCLDLRGSLDIRDAWELTEFLGTQPWSSGKVGFIGASYPGSEAHIAAIANNPHLGGVVPVVASTSFYHYHHKGGVPYNNHVATNVAYNQNAATPTLNPQYANWPERQVREAHECDQAQQVLEGLDASGAYDAWWRDRDLRWRTSMVKVPVLMAQGLADWNVKPDHVASWFNDLAVRKTLIAGQWGHQWPEDSAEAYGTWWGLVTAFFDETLRGQRTGLFDRDVAYVQDTEKAWRALPAWPPRDARWLALNLTQQGLSLTAPPGGAVGWEARAAPPGALAAGALTPALEAARNTQVELVSEPLHAAMRVSGTPYLDLTITSTAEHVHLVAVLEVEDAEEAGTPLFPADGWRRENHGYLDPRYREGLEQPLRLVPGEPTPVRIPMYPQEDVFPAGARLRLVLRSVDEGRTMPLFDDASIAALLDAPRPGQLWLPLRPEG